MAVSPEEIMHKAAEYVKTVQPQLDDFKSRHDAFVKGASGAAKVLVDQGLIAKEAESVFVQKVAEDPSSIWGFLEKLANSFTADSLGSGAPAGIKSASSVVDPWEARLFPELYSGYGQVAD
jgi:hypothetical protein